MYGALIVNKNLHILSRLMWKKWDPIEYYFLLYLNVVFSLPEDGRSRPKHVAKYNLIVIIASCLDVCCVLTVHNILYKFGYTQQDGFSVLAMCLVYMCVCVCGGGTRYVPNSKIPVKYEGERICVKVPFVGRKLGEGLNWDDPWIFLNHMKKQFCDKYLTMRNS